MANIAAENDFEDFFEHSLSGFISTTPKGVIVQSNPKIQEWLSYEREALSGKRLSSLFAVGSRMFYETHLFPLLKLKGFFEEISVELLTVDGDRLQVLMNGYIKKDADGNAEFVRLTFYRATERKVYEQNLRHSISDKEKTLESANGMVKVREQFIAVLGHDLRNPLGAIKSGVALLKRSSLSERDLKLLNTIDRSSFRMQELITNVMDFARVRLGEGIKLDLEEVLIEPFLSHIVDELAITFPKREIITLFDVPHALQCDANRISQMVSNLLANALTHGDINQPVTVTAQLNDSNFILEVKNGGNPISEEILTVIFEPFKREASSPSQQGLGLGLYIASQIAKAHNGSLSVSSNLKETVFTFKMSVDLNLVS